MPGFLVSCAAVFVSIAQCTIMQEQNKITKITTSPVYYFALNEKFSGDILENSSLELLNYGSTWIGL